MKSFLGIIMLGAAVVVVVMFVRPKLAEVSSIKSELATYSAALDKAEELRMQRERLLSVYNSLDASKINKLESMLPSNIDNVKLAIEIENVASGLGLSLKGLDVKDPTESNQANRASGNQAVQDSPYGTAEISFVVVGDYNKFTELMTRLEKSLRLIDVQKLEFNAPRGEVAKTGVFEFRVAVNTYWLRDELVKSTYEQNT